MGAKKEKKNSTHPQLLLKCSVKSSCVLTLMPEHAFKLFPMNKSNLLGAVRELAEHRRPKYGQMD